MATTRTAGRGKDASDEEFLQALYRGGELLAAGKVIEAKEHLETAYGLQPKNEKAQNLLGLTCFKLGLFDRAAEIYEALVRENPADPTLRVNLGLVYLKTNALQRAVREFETATDLAPEHQKAQNYLGLALAQQGEYGRAREHFILAGSDAMAEKMARAIAGESFAKPAPVQPAAERGFAEIEGNDVIAASERAAQVEEVHVEDEDAYGEEQVGGEESWGDQIVGDADELGAEVSPPSRTPPPPREYTSPVPPGTAEAELAQLADRASEPEAGDVVILRPEDAVAVSEPEAASQELRAGGDSVDDAFAPYDESGAETGEGELSFQAVGEHVTSSTPAATEEPFHFDTPPPVKSGETHAAAGYQAHGAAANEASFAEVAEHVVPAPELFDYGPRGAESAAHLETTYPVAGAEAYGAVTDYASAGEGAYEGEPSAAGAESYEGAVSEASATGAAESYEGAAGSESGAEGYATGAAESYDGGVASESGAEGYATRGAEGATQEGAEEDLEFVAEGRKAPEVQAAVGAEAATTQVAEGLPRLREWVRASDVFASAGEARFSVDADGATVRVSGGLCTRIAGMVAVLGSVEFAPVLRRTRGRSSDRPFGVGAVQMMRASGDGMIRLRKPHGRWERATLEDDSVYFVEERVFAFEDGLVYDNGRIAVDVAPDIDLVNLRGEGAVLLHVPGVVQSAAILPGAPVTVPAERLVGWLGDVNPKVVVLAASVAGSPRVGLELSGEGWAIFSSSEE